MGSRAGAVAPLRGPADNHKDFWWGSVDVSDVAMAMCSFDIQSDVYQMPSPDRAVSLRPIDIAIATTAEHGMTLSEGRLIGVSPPYHMADRWLFGVGIDPDYQEKLGQNSSNPHLDLTYNIIRYIPEALKASLPSIAEDRALDIIFEKRFKTAMFAVGAGLAPAAISPFLESKVPLGSFISTLAVGSLAFNQMLTAQQVNRQRINRGVLERDAQLISAVVSLDIMNAYGVAKHQLGIGSEDTDDNNDS